MIIFPLIAALESGAFAFLLLRQYSQKKRIQQLAWGVSLAMFAVASLVVALGTTQQWDPTLYRIFYVFGAMLTVPWLALGSIALLNKRELTLPALVIVLVMSVYGFVKVLGAKVTMTIVASTSSGSITRTVFGHHNIPSGSDVWRADSAVRSLAIWYSTIAYIIVVLIAVYSSRPRKGVAPPKERVRANLLIAVGVTIVAIGSTALVRYGRGAAFSITLAIGVTVMFVGFLLASRAPRHPVEEPGDSPT